jgi:hypothetical protein
MANDDDSDRQLHGGGDRGTARILTVESSGQTLETRQTKKNVAVTNGDNSDQQLHSIKRQRNRTEINSGVVGTNNRNSASNGRQRGAL